MCRFLLAFFASGCGEVVPPMVADAGVDAGPASCTDYCEQATACGWEAPAGCCTSCNCIQTRLFRPAIGARYLRCLAAATCESSPADCLDEATTQTSPTATGSEYATACQKRQSSGCLTLDCNVSRFFADPILESLLDCLGADSCAAVLECNDLAGSGSCPEGPAC